jgi:uncharacterized protein (TIGR02246 family)
MITKQLLSGAALAGAVMLGATADESAASKPTQKSPLEVAEQTQPPTPAAPPSETPPAVKSAPPVKVAPALKAPGVKSAPAERPAASEKAPSADQSKSEQVERKQSPDEADIREIDEAFVKAYEAGDAQAVAAFFTPDAEYVDATGTVFQGRDAIEASLAEFFEESPACNLEINAESIRTISPGVVVQDGTTLVTRDDSLLPVECRYTTVYVKTDGKWMVASVRDSAPHGLREHSLQLEQLSWLQGDWVDEGDDSIVHFSCEPVENGNFLLRTFTIVIRGEEAMSGTQRIGWDPQSGKLRSWIFDSEGAYADGLWHRDEENDRWVLKTTGVTADGQTASSTSLYTFVNEHTMTWQSVDHEIAGVQQPDSEIITIVRSSPAPTPAIAAETQE